MDLLIGIFKYNLIFFRKSDKDSSNNSSLVFSIYFQNINNP
jgi:hypothetical protein